MSGNNLSGNDEFDEQLRMQELYGGDPKEGDTQNEPSGEAHSLGQPPDDTPYEWDLDKKAWFPKITEDFIATYQANYGFSSDGASSSTANVQDANTKAVEEPPQKEVPETPDSKRKGKRERLNLDGSMLKKTEIQMYTCQVSLQTSQWMNLFSSCPNLALL